MAFIIYYRLVMHGNSNINEYMNIYIYKQIAAY